MNFLILNNSSVQLSIWCFNFAASSAAVHYTKLISQLLIITLRDCKFRIISCNFKNRWKNTFWAYNLCRKDIINFLWMEQKIHDFIEKSLCVVRLVLWMMRKLIFCTSVSCLLNKSCAKHLINYLQGRTSIPLD